MYNFMLRGGKLYIIACKRKLGVEGGSLYIIICKKSLFVGNYV